MIIYTVGDLIKELQKYDPEEDIGIYSHGQRERYIRVTETVVQPSDWGAPAPVSIYGHKEDEPYSVMVYLGDYAENDSNIEIYKARGTHVSVEDVKNMIQLDRKPWVYTDPVSKKKTRLTSKKRWENEDITTIEFDPRRGYSQEREDYS